MTRTALSLAVLLITAACASALTGPEVIAGSTRLKAGTAQKLVLNMLSTAVFTRLGHTHRGRMVGVVAANDVQYRQAEGNELTIEATAPAAAGEIKLTVRVDPLPGEASLDRAATVVTFSIACNREKAEIASAATSKAAASQITPYMVRSPAQASAASSSRRRGESCSNDASQAAGRSAHTTRVRL